MKISSEDVQFFADPDYELNEEIADQIAQVLADTWENDYDYETFMQDGVYDEIRRMLEENPDLEGKGITTIPEDEVERRIERGNI